MGSTNVANKSFQLGSNSPFEPYENPNPILPVGVIHLAPNSGQSPLFNADLAIWEFPANTFSQWSKFALGDYPLGTVVRYVGYGLTATINPFEVINGSRGVRRWGENVISIYAYGSFQIPTILFSDFDANEVDFYQDGGPIELECGVASRDSGGPTLVWEAGEWRIIRINGGGGGWYRRNLFLNLYEVCVSSMDHLCLESQRRPYTLAT